MDIKEGIARKLQAIMPTIIRDYVNNNETVQFKDMLIVAGILVDYETSQGVVQKVDLDRVNESDTEFALVKPLEG
jgi:hypothetical protein